MYLVSTCTCMSCYFSLVFNACRLAHTSTHTTFLDWLVQFCAFFRQAAFFSIAVSSFIYPYIHVKIDIQYTYQGSHIHIKVFMNISRYLYIHIKTYKQIKLYM